jgi:hypothetical protein
MGGREMRVQVIHGSVPQTHQLLRPALARVVEFTRAYDGDADPNILFAMLAHQYFSENPQSIMWVGLDDKERIVAHGYASIEEYYGTKTVMVHQFWKNAGQSFEPGQVEEVIEVMQRWGRGNGAVELRCIAYSEQVAAALEKYGWVRTSKVLMSQSIGEDEE